ncbi:MAG TPA: response regulator [Candidatus Acidoferrum sp.]|nr:response regulator [Candidatus Acidoferrum sp.]
MAIPLRVLFIEDAEDDAALQARLLRQAGYDVYFERVDSRNALAEALDKKWEVIISDYSMPGFTGIDALKLVRASGSDTPFIFVSGTIGEDTAVAALKVGAQDYLMKTNLSRLIPAIQRELREAEDRKQRRRLEQQVHQLRRFEAIGRLAGGVAHDFNNVIGAIMGWAEMGHEEAPEGSQLQDRFLKIRSQAERAASLTRQLLAFARRQILQPDNTNLNELVKEEISLLRNVIGEHIGIHMDLAENLSAIWADPGQVEQVLMNLCLNARDAMPEGGELHIDTGNFVFEQEHQHLRPYVVPGRYVLLRVSDTGMGMPPETLEHIFEPFFTTKETGKGTGLGLATVYGIVKQHKGFIDVESTPNEGTTFRVYLPVGEAAASAPQKPTEESIRGGRERILFAEDNDDIRDVTTQLLQTLGYEVATARDGAEAVELFGKMHTSVDLVLLDIIMPGMMGPQAYAHMSAMRPDLPVIFTTGYATESNLLAARARKNAVILPKPYGSRQLAQKLREALDEHLN